MLEEFISARESEDLPGVCFFTKCLFEFHFKKTKTKEEDCKQASTCIACKKHCGETVFNGMEIAFGLKFREPMVYHSREMIEVISSYNGKSMDCSTLHLLYKGRGIFLNHEMSKEEVIGAIKTELLGSVF